MAKILIVAPHMDDEVLGMGGTIARHVDNGDEVYVCIIAHRIYNHVFDKKSNDAEVDAAKKVKDIFNYHEVKFLDLPDERLDVAVQDIIIPLEKYFNKVKPEVLYINFFEDNNQDHRAVFSAVRVLIRSYASGSLKKIYMYETPSSTEQSPPYQRSLFQANYYVDIEDYWEKKMKAFRSYQREKKKMPHPRSEEALKALAVKRGVESGLNLAEGFMVIRDIWK
ncbi:MAG: PIG-L family deacetylase [Spirochaetes bacterium]|nr:PIG-L family deacetylase [Spirochaetota bacterium]